MMAASKTNHDTSWEKSGKTEFLEQCTSHAEDRDRIQQILYDVCLKVIHGQMKPESIAISLSELININKDFSNVLSDVLLLFGKLPLEQNSLAVQLEKSLLIHIRNNARHSLNVETAENREQRDQYLNFLNICNNKVLSESLLKERLDYDTTSEAQVIPNKKVAHTKFIKVKTRLFYKQQKFNLCREESEGYAKLITELCQDSGFDYNHMLQIIKALIGCFNLDPNRVLDIILECFECRLHLHKYYIPLVKCFLDNSSTLSQILAFKFCFYQKDAETITPSSLYLVTAFVLHHKLIELDELYPYLTPKDSKILEFHRNELNDAKTFAKKINFVANTEMRPIEETLSDADKHLLILNNQKLGLAKALLKVGDWESAKDLINRLPEYYVISNEKIVKEMCNLIHFAIDKLYRRYSGLPAVLASKLKEFKPKHELQIRQVDNVEELRTSIFPMLMVIGPFLHYDTLLLAKIMRVCRTLLPTCPEKGKYDFFTILDESVLPAITLVESNCGLSEELWLLLRTFPYNHRYRFYTNWKTEPQNAFMIKTRAQTMKRIKYIMKRLSKENVKQSGRQIGKLSHSNPTYLFEYILSQIQSYDNLICPVVDSLKYLTTGSYDVLSFCIIEALVNPSKEKTKHDGATISPWLLSLANFCGSVVKKYTIELPGLLQFVANQLKAEKCLDLLILKEVVQKMAGIEASEEMTDEQLAALSGGKLLRSEGGYFNQVRNTKKSSIRLKDALLENNLAMPLCILMAQQRNWILFHEQEHSHLKLIGKLYDHCQETLVQYGSFLSNNLSIEDYSGRLPSLDKLIAEYNLSPDVAFFLVRPMIVHDITSKFDELKKKDKNDRSSANYQHIYIDSSEIVTKPLVERIIPAFPNKFWEELSPQLFVTFWTLSMYDLHVPTNSYQRQINQFKSTIQQVEENKDLAPNKKKKEKERCQNMIDRLNDEQNKQIEHTKRVNARMQKEKEKWFQKQQRFEMTTQFLQHCLFPRCKFTASDALYCAKFVHLLHCLKTPNFSTLICYDRIFGDISYTMCSCTENEANHYGRFLCELLDTVMKWHKTKSVFDEECSKYPGFVQTFREKDPVYVDFENYRHVCHKWHYRMTKACILCLDSGDYIQIRNCLIVLTKILPFFPVMLSFAQAIKRRVDNIRTEEKEKRPDLYALATGYSGQLKAKEPSFIPESEFHVKEVKKPPPTTQPAPPITNNNSPHNKVENVKVESPPTIVVKTSKSNSKEKKESIKVKVENENSDKKKESKIEAKKEEKKEKKDEKKREDKKKDDKKKEEKKKEDRKNEKQHSSNEKSFNKSHPRSSPVSASPRRTTDRIKEETKNEREEKKNENKHSNNIDKASNKSDSRSSSVCASPRRTNERIKEEPDERVDHKRRKADLKNEESRDSKEKSIEKRTKTEEVSPSPVHRSHDKKSSSRKRQNEGEEISNDSKRRKDDDSGSKSKRTDERNSNRKSGENRKSSSRRHKIAEEK